MLQECRRVAIKGGRMHFSVNLPAPNISPSEYQEALDVGPPFVDAPVGYEPLLQESGWHILDRIDLSSEYRQTLQTLVDGLTNNTPQLQAAFGDEFVSQRQRREDQVALIERSILQREVFVTSAN